MILITILNTWSCCEVWLAWYHHVAQAGVTLAGVLLPQSQAWHPVGQCLQAWAPAPAPTYTYLINLFLAFLRWGLAAESWLASNQKTSCLGLTCVRNTGVALHLTETQPAPHAGQDVSHRLCAVWQQRVTVLTHSDNLGLSFLNSNSHRS